MKAKILIVSVMGAFLSFQSYGKGGSNAVVYAAAAQGDIVRLKEYFVADTNLVSSLNSLLRTAALNGQKDAAEFLIALGADVNEKGFFDMAPLAHMAMYGTTNDEKCAQVAAVLIANGAEVDPVDQYGATPLLRAVEMKKIKLARLLLEHGASPARTYGKTYFTPLHYAMRDRDMEMIKLLLDFKAPLDVVDPDRTAPLMRAVASRNHAVARLLLEHGAKITAPRNEPGLRKQSERYWSIQNDNMEKTPMLRAITFRDTEMVALLLEFKAPLDTVDQDGKTPLHWAAQSGNKEIVKLLVEAKAPLNVVDYGGATPLFWAEAGENKEIIQLLRQAAPSVPGISISGIAPPSRETMHAIAKSISEGDTAAFDELISAAENLYREVDYRKDEARLQLGYSRMKAAFDPLGTDAGKGNDNAFQALKKSLSLQQLNSFAPDALGIAAAAGHREALDILLHYKQWNILETSAGLALVAAAKANQQPAVDYFTEVLLAPANAYRGVYGAAREGLEGAAAKGNEKAKQALEKFAAASAQQNN